MFFVRLEMYFGTTMMCATCEEFVDDPNILTTALTKKHIICAMELIKGGTDVDASHVSVIIGLDNVVVLDFVMDHVPSISIFFTIWERSIDHNSFHIMDYLMRKKHRWELDIEYAATFGNIKCIKFLMEKHDRVPSFLSVIAAVEYDYLEILQYFIVFSRQHLKFRSQLWKAVSIAIENGRYECLKCLLVEDNTYWQPTIMIGVWQRWNTYVISDTKNINGIMECMRFIYDDPLLVWPYFLCPMLLDNCTLVYCDTCITQEMCIVDHHQVLQECLGQFPEDIVVLLMSFSCSYHKCDYCGVIENWKTKQRYIRCSLCKTTYYCGEQCRVSSWEQNHKKKCIDLNLITD